MVKTFWLSGGFQFFLKLLDGRQLGCVEVSVAYQFDLELSHNGIPTIILEECLVNVGQPMDNGPFGRLGFFSLIEAIKSQVLLIVAGGVL